MKTETVVTIQGVGTFLIPTDKVSNLIAYLQSLKAVGVNENTNFGGEQLLRG
jgi:hypothetical protein